MIHTGTLGQISQRIKNHFRALNTSERVVVTALFLHQLSLWPSLSINRFGGITLELSMLTGIVLIGYCLKLYGLKLIDKIVTKHSRWIFMWLAYSAGLAMALTSQHAYIGMRALHIASVIIGAFCVWLLHQDKKIDLHKIMVSWMYLILFLTPVFIAQYLLASFGVDEVVKHAYKVGVFQFPRLHGFTFEPLFLANWFLAPLIYALHKSRERFFSYFAGLISALLFLTLARSAVHGLVIGLVVYLSVSSNKKAHFIAMLKPLLAGLVAAFIFVGIASTANNSNAIDGISRFMDHMTLGVFNKEGSKNVNYRDVEVVQDDGSVATESYIDGAELDTEGVVEGSTVGRLQSIKQGLEIFKEHPLTGVGMLRAGEEANKDKPEVFKGTKFVTNSFPVDILAESGIIGLCLLLGYIVSARKLIFRLNNLLLVMCVAFLVQSLFFSSLVMLPFWIVIALVVGKQDKDLTLETRN